MIAGTRLQDDKRINQAAPRSLQARGVLEMSSTKHPKGKSPFADDLQRNPGIGQSKGSFATGIPPEEIEGDNTVEGDVENDTTATDGLPQEERERTTS
jgi:hypothetical protein